MVASDYLPAEVTFSSASGACQHDGSPNDGTVTCTLASLAAGDSVQFTIVVTVDSAVEPGTSIENLAVVTSDTPDPDLSNNVDTVDTSILGLADLILRKFGPATVIAGEQITYTILVINDGPSSAQSVVVQDGLPQGVTLDSATIIPTVGPPAPCGGTTCNVGDMAAGDSVTIIVVGTVDPAVAAGTQLTNVATVLADTPDDDLSNNSDSVVTTVGTEADLAVDKIDLSDPVGPTEGLIYQISVMNDGASDAQGVVITDTLGANLTFSSASPGCVGSSGSDTVVCTINTLPAGDSAFFLIAVTVGDVPSGTILINEVEVASGTFDPNLVDNYDIEYTTVEQDFGPSADLGIDKQATPAMVNAGDLVTYTLTVTNAGPSTATNVQVLELLPAGTTLISIVPDNPDFGHEFCTTGGICYMGTVGTGTIATITTVLQVNPDFGGDSITNMANVSGDQIDYFPDNNFDSATISVTVQPLVDLALVKLASPTVHAGQTVYYTLTVYNDGPFDATNVVVSDTLPGQVVFATASAGCADMGGGTVVCTEALLAVDDSTTFTITVTTDNYIEPGTSLENMAVVACDAAEADGSNNMDTADTSVIDFVDWNRYYLPIIQRLPRPELPPIADLIGSFYLTPNKLTFDAEEPLTITVVVENQGTAPASSFWVDFYINPEPDPPPVNLPWQAACPNAPVWCYGIAWQVTPGLEAGEAITLTSTVDSYDPDQTFWPGYFGAGATDLYVRVDSWSLYGDYGAVMESDEGNNLSELHGLTVTGEMMAPSKRSEWPPRALPATPR